ncbi:MAG: hypothetical protein Q4B63_04535 [Clostridium perfringens]|nr:hypothetical protein [Clostridium perfringens]
MLDFAIKDVLYLSSEYCSEETINHHIRICKFSLALFNALKDPYDLTKDEKLVLIGSSLLHDIGKYMNDKDHHRYSKNIILGDKRFYYLFKTLTVPVSVVAFSHGKAISTDIKILEDFDEESILKIISILRVCDSIDYYKDDSFDIYDVLINPYEIIINVNFRYDKGFLKIFDSRKRLFENTFRKVLTINYR